MSAGKVAAASVKNGTLAADAASQTISKGQFAAKALLGSDVYFNGQTVADIAAKCSNPMQLDSAANPPKANGGPACPINNYDGPNTQNNYTDCVQTAALDALTMSIPALAHHAISHVATALKESSPDSVAGNLLTTNLSDLPQLLASKKTNTLIGSPETIPPDNGSTSDNATQVSNTTPSTSTNSQPVPVKTTSALDLQVTPSKVSDATVPSQTPKPNEPLSTNENSVSAQQTGSISVATTTKTATLDSSGNTVANSAARSIENLSDSPPVSLAPTASSDVQIAKTAGSSLQTLTSSYDNIAQAQSKPSEISSTGQNTAYAQQANSVSVTSTAKTATPVLDGNTLGSSLQRSIQTIEGPAEAPSTNFNNKINNPTNPNMEIAPKASIQPISPDDASAINIINKQMSAEDAIRVQANMKLSDKVIETKGPSGNIVKTSERIMAAENSLGIKMTEDQKTAFLAAHSIEADPNESGRILAVDEQGNALLDNQGKPITFDKYTNPKLADKIDLFTGKKILTPDEKIVNNPNYGKTKTPFTKNEAIKLIREGYTGSNAYNTSLVGIKNSITNFFKNTFVKNSRFDSATVSKVLNIPQTSLFPIYSDHQFFIWNADKNVASIRLVGKETSYEFLGKIIQGLDSSQERALISGKNQMEWKKIVAAIENGGNSKPIALDKSGLTLKVECRYQTCHFYITNQSKGGVVVASTLARFGDKVVYEPRLEEKTFSHLLEHKLPPGLPPPSSSSKIYGLLNDGTFWGGVGGAKQYFRSETEFHQFIDLAKNIGFEDPAELTEFLTANGYYRGVELILDEVKANTSLKEIKLNLLKISESVEVKSQSGRSSMPKLTFANLPEITIYRGTTLPMSELSRLFKMNWKDYYERFNDNLAAGGMDGFSGGKYFTIDPAVAQRFAVYNSKRAPAIRTESWFSVSIEAAVPASRLKKESEMSRWDFTEFQYDPSSIKPEEIQNFVFYLRNGNTVKVPGELLRMKDFNRVRKILGDAGVSGADIRMLLDERGPAGKLTFKRDGSGTTGGKWFIDEGGQEWYVKPDSYYPELQTSAEVISSRIYEFFGYKVPETVIVNINGKRYSASRSLGAGQLDTLDDNQTAEFRQMRIIAAYLKDYDRLQYGPNNLNLGNSRFALLDFGGTLGSRAQGGHKPGEVVSNAIGSFERTQDINTIYNSFNIDKLPVNHPWRKITLLDAMSVIAKFRGLTNEKIEEIVDAAQYTQPSDRAFMIQALEERRDGIISNLLSRFPLR